MARRLAGSLAIRPARPLRQCFGVDAQLVLALHRSHSCVVQREINLFAVNIDRNDKSLDGITDTEMLQNGGLLGRREAGLADVSWDRDRDEIAVSA